MTFGRWLFAASATFASCAAYAQPTFDQMMAVTQYHQPIVEADRRGDFSGAVRLAENCLKFLETNHAQGGFGFCAYYLGSAVRNGKGVPRDPQRAFNLLSNLASRDPDGDSALDVAEMYLNGEGTSRNPIEAAVLVWRVDHGLWSIYGPNWGMCTVCEDTRVQRKALHERFAQELSPDEELQVAAIESSRFPKIVAQVRRRNEQFLLMGLLAVAIAVGSLGATLYFTRRQAKRAIA